MNALIGTYDPEQIDQDVSTYYRNITKLERTFTKVPAPLAIAKTVSLNVYLLCTYLMHIILIGCRPL